MYSDICSAQKGFAGRREKFRVAWSLNPLVWNPKNAATTKSYRGLKSLGIAGVEYIRGRDEAKAYLRRIEKKFYSA